MTDTTTNAATQDEALLQAQPPVDEQSAAADTPDSEPTPTPDQQPAEEAGDAPTPSEDDDLADYWAKKGIDITTPEGQRQAAKSYREAEKAMHQKAQQASELEKQINRQPLDVDTDNELVRQALEKANALETTMAVQQWKQVRNITPEQDKALGKYVTENPQKAYLLKNGYLTLDDIYSMSGIGTVDPSEAKSQGKKEALQDIANQQRTTAVAGAATTAAPAQKEDPLLDVLTSDE